MWVFSEEMLEYRKYGYKFQIIKGYSFNRKNLFREFIDNLYSIKQNTAKDDPMYLISKLLMNSLFGRFGMELILNDAMIINTSEIYSFIQNKNFLIENITELTKARRDLKPRRREDFNSLQKFREDG